MSYQFSQDPEENLPDWLRELRARQEAEEGEGTEGTQPNVEAEDEGLADTQPQPSFEVKAGAEPESPPSEAADTEPDEGEPDWLLDIRRRIQHDQPAEAADERPPSEPPPASEEIEESAEAALLSDTQPQPPSPAFLGEPEAAGASPFAEESPEPEEEAPPDEHARAFRAGPEDFEVELPDWFLEEEEPAGEMPSTPAFGEPSAEDSAPEEEEEPLAPAQLPSWLQALRPPGVSMPRGETEFADEEEGRGPLAGLSGVLPVEPEMLHIGHTGSLPGDVVINASQQRHVKAFQQILENEYAAKEDFHRRISLPNRLLRLGIAAFLLLAALVPLLTGSHNSIRPDAQSQPEAAALFQIVEELPADSPVLVAFEVQPSLYGEVQAVAATVLEHLLEQQARLVFISTSPTGPALAERLLRQQLSAQPSVASGDYLNLGYLSGDMAGLRQLITAPRTFHPDQWQSPTLAGVETLSDFGMVLVISSEGEGARTWIEQVGAQLPDGLVVAASAQAGPLLNPYIDSQPNSLRALVAGLSGAAYYEALRGEDGVGRAYWDAYSYGVGAMVVLILLGGLYGRLIHIRPEQRPQTIDEMDEMKDEETD
jgi:hypothetical protein